MSPIYNIKLVLFGNESVGKTSMVERYIHNKFQQEYISTLGYNVYQKRLEYGEYIINFAIFDIGGQERFKEIRKKYAAGANAAFLVYDITNRDSFNNIINWYNDLMEFTSNAFFIIVGNKIDLINRQVTKEEGVQLAEQLNANGFIETSAKDGIMINEAFSELAKRILDKISGKL